MNHIRTILVLAATMALAGACGGLSNPFAAAGKPNSQDQLLKYAQCMRAHGINMSDPVNGRITIQGQGPSPDANGNVTSNAPNQAMQAAQQACQKYLPNGGNSNRQPTQAEIDAATKFAQCLRDHGIPASDPQPGPNGGLSQSIGNGGNGAQKIDPNQMQAAMQACQKYQPGPKNGGGGGSGQGTGTTTSGS